VGYGIESTSSGVCLKEDDKVLGWVCTSLNGTYMIDSQQLEDDRQKYPCKGEAFDKLLTKLGLTISLVSGEIVKKIK